MCKKCAVIIQQFNNIIILTIKNNYLINFVVKLETCNNLQLLVFLICKIFVEFLLVSCNQVKLNFLLSI